MYFENKFDCTACGYDFEREDSVAECRKCHDSFCEQCVTEEGVCVPCWD